MKVKSESELAQSCPTQWTYGLQPPRLLHPWDLAGKSTGVGCHCLLRLAGERMRIQGKESWEKQGSSLREGGREKGGRWGITKTNDCINWSSPSLMNHRWLFRKSWEGWLCYPSTSKNSLSKVFPMHWKFTHYFSTVYFTTRLWYLKVLFIQVSPVQQVIQVLQFSFYSPSCQLWLVWMLINTSTAGVQQWRELKLKPFNFAAHY